jgi:hypothetical protein
MQLIFPTYNFNVKNTENGNYIFDIIRKKFVLLTPEEWVRQHLLHYLKTTSNCPASLIAVEKGLVHNGLRKRFDVLVYNNLGKPVLLAECKSPYIQLDASTFAQAAVYNRSFHVKHLLITNGIGLYLCTYSDDFTSYVISNQVPEYPFV